MRAAAVVVVVSVAACGSGAGGDDDDEAADANDAQLDETHNFITGEFTGAEVQYGLAPSRDGEVTFQPDVVIVDGGAESVRSVSDDGLLWTIDGDANGVEDLEPQKVMFVTSRGLGRVVRVEPAGDDVEVLLGPVNFTDVVRDGTISVDQPLDLDNVALLETPAEPGIVTDPSLDAPADEAPPATDLDSGTPDATGASDTRVLRLPPVQLVAKTKDGKLPPPSFGTAYQATIGGISAKLSASSESGFTLQLGLSGEGGPKGSIVFQAKWNKPKIKSTAVIENGELKRSEFRLDGLNEIDIKVQAGSQNGTEDNLKTRIELPIDFAWPLPPFGGMPLAAIIRNKFILDTAFSAKDATLIAHGTYGVNGPIGGTIEGGSTTALTPTISVKKSLVDSLSGLSIGVDGLVFAYQIKVIVGAGIPAFVVGPHLGVTFSIGMTRGSSIGLIVCRGALLDIAMNVGLGFKFDFKKIGLDEAYAHHRHAIPSWLKLEGDFLDFKVPLFHRQVTHPEVSLCAGGPNSA